MNTKKSLAESVNEVLTSTMSTAKKAQALVKIGLTNHEAMALAARGSIASTGQAFSYTFGVEIETIHCGRHAFADAARRNGLAFVDHLGQYSGCHTDIPQFKLVPDGSLSGQDAAECVTPALNGSADGFNALRQCCNALREVGATVNSSCGLHVHIGAANLTEQQYCNVFYNYKMLEAAIDSFMAESRRDNNGRWCRTLQDHNFAYCRTRQDISTELCYDRYHKVNSEAYARHQTIEFRQHQGTVNYTKISAWVKFLGKLVEYSRNNRLQAKINRVEDITFLSAEEKQYFISRRNALTRGAE